VRKGKALTSSLDLLSVLADHILVKLDGLDVVPADEALVALSHLRLSFL